MDAISTTTLGHLNEHEIYFLIKHDIPTLDTEWTLRIFQQSLNNSPFCPPVIIAFTDIFKLVVLFWWTYVQEKQPSITVFFIQYIDFIVLYVSAYVQSHLRQGSRYDNTQDRHHWPWLIILHTSIMECWNIPYFSVGTFLNMFNPLKTKRRLLYLKTQFSPRSKPFSSRL